MNWLDKIRLSSPWKYKAPLLIAFPYLVILNEGIPFNQAIQCIGLSFMTIIGIAAFGYFTNDISDRKVDSLAGKANHMVGRSVFQIILLLFFSLMVALLPWIWLPKDDISVLLISVELLAFVLYAFKPFRFKERAYLGLLFDMMYAHLIPTLLAYHTFNLIAHSSAFTDDSILYAILAWQIFLGLRNILYHQYRDAENDSLSNVKSDALSIGKDRTLKWIKTFVGLELISLLLVTVFLCKITFVPLIAWGVYMLSERKRILAHNDFKSWLYFVSDKFNLLWFPVCILAELAILDPRFMSLLGLHLILFDSVILEYLRIFLRRLKR